MPGKRFAVVGHPIAHSRSPDIHWAFAQQAGIALDYERIEAPLTADGRGFIDTVQAFFAAGGSGLNITAPFKNFAAEKASSVSERSQLAAAANTLSPDGQGRWRADNTDGVGLWRDLTGRLGLTLTDRCILILGAGGASAGILTDLLAAQPAHLALWNRSTDKAQQLAARFAHLGPVQPLTNFAQIQTPFDLIIHATSLRETPDGWPWPASLCTPATFFYDLIYLGKPAAGNAPDNESNETPFLRWAKMQAPEGVRGTSDGFGMLVEQAAESFFIWHGVHPDTAPVIAAR